MQDTIVEGDHPMIISAKFGWDWLSSFRAEDFFLISSPLFFYFELGGHLGWKSGSPNTVLEWATQGPFHQSLVAIDPVVSEEKIKMTYGRTTAKSDGNSSYDLTAKSDRKNIRIPQALIVIGHLHISDFDSKIMRFSGVIYLEGGQ